jgi:hypothetical protein
MKFSSLLAVLSFMITLDALASDLDIKKEMARIKEMIKLEEEEASKSSEIELSRLFKSGYARWENNNHLILGNGRINTCMHQNGLKISASMSICSINVKNGFITINGTDFNNAVSVDLKLKDKEAIIRAYQPN